MILVPGVHTTRNNEMGVFCLCYFKFPYHGVRDKRKLCETYLGFIVGQIVKSLDYLDCVNVGLVCGKKEDLFSEPLPSFAYTRKYLKLSFFLVHQYYDKCLFLNNQEKIPTNYRHFRHFISIFFFYMYIYCQKFNAEFNKL